MSICLLLFVYYISRQAFATAGIGGNAVRCNLRSRSTLYSILQRDTQLISFCLLWLPTVLLRGLRDAIFSQFLIKYTYLCILLLLNTLPLSANTIKQIDRLFILYWGVNVRSKCAPPKHANITYLPNISRTKGLDGLWILIISLHNRKNY